jgi:hypothetical protein
MERLLESRSLRLERVGLSPMHFVDDWTNLCLSISKKPLVEQVAGWSFSLNMLITSLVINTTTKGAQIYLKTGKYWKSLGLGCPPTGMHSL